MSERVRVLIICGTTTLFDDRDGFGGLAVRAVVAAWLMDENSTLIFAIFVSPVK